MDINGAKRAYHTFAGIKFIVTLIIVIVAAFAVATLLGCATLEEVAHEVRNAALEQQVIIPEDAARAVDQIAAIDVPDLVEFMALLHDEKRITGEEYEEFIRRYRIAATNYAIAYQQMKTESPSSQMAKSMIQKIGAAIFGSIYN